MTGTVGIYRGSFDPPHRGHVETVKCALLHGMNKIVITYVDPNPNKPGRSQNDLRQKLLGKLFEAMPEVAISEKSFRATLVDLLDNPAIEKIRLIVGSDLLETTFRPMPHKEKLDCFLIPRYDFPFETAPPFWNGMPVSVADRGKLVDLQLSSSKVRTALANNELTIASRALTHPLVEIILSEGAYSTPLQALAAEHIPKSDHPLSFHACTEGVSEDQVFFVKDKESQRRLVVKVFANQERFESELAGYNLLNTLTLKYVRVPKIYYAQEKTILMEYIEGKPLARLMGHSREAVELCAKANLELHLSCTSQTSPPSSLHTALLDSIRLHSPALAERLRPRWDALTKAFLQNPGLQSLTHGDPNHFNWIVDLGRQTVTYIDVSKFQLRGFAMQEFYEAQLCFRTAAKRVGGIDKQQVHAICEVYKQAYFEQAPNTIATLESRAFFEGYWKLHIIVSRLSLGQSIEREAVEFLTSKEESHA